MNWQKKERIASDHVEKWADIRQKLLILPIFPHFVVQANFYASLEQAERLGRERFTKRVARVK
jgi:hypothetical protein